jgi:hypothetical protein
MSLLKIKLQQNAMSNQLLKIKLAEIRQLHYITSRKSRHVCQITPYLKYTTCQYVNQVTE